MKEKKEKQSLSINYGCYKNGYAPIYKVLTKEELESLRGILIKLATNDIFLKPTFKVNEVTV